MKVAIIGAGPAGITAAYALVKKGVVVDIFEASETPGGMAKTIELWDQRVDTGPHRFFSKDKRVNQLWLEVVGNDYQIVDRLTRILYQQKFYSYPLSPLNALKNIGLSQAVLCLIYYLKEVILPTKQDGSFETWVTHRFGKRLYEIFFKSYSEKLWGIPCSELDSDFASQRIKKLSFFKAVKNSFLKTETKQHRTLLEQFAYPCQGTGMVYQRMADFVEKHGGKIHYKTPVERIKVENQVACAIELINGRTVEGYDHIVSTMPLSLLVSRLKDIPQQVKDAALALRFRNTILIYLNVDAIDLFPDQWIYIQSPEFKCGRITNFRNWVPQLYGEQKSTILALEYWCNEEDLLWKDTEENLIRMAEDELKLLGFSKGPILGGHVEKISRCYPVYNKGYNKKIEIIQEFLKTIQGLSVIGRYGSFKYNNQDHSILMGLQAADNIGNGKHHDLWGINTDYEDYQESYIITKTGLIKELKMTTDKVAQCVELILKSKNTIVLTGAGISTNAGIPDFRGPQGLYTSRLYDAEKVFDIAYFLKDPKPFYEFAYDFIALESTIKPTITHHALVALEGAGKIQMVITQNIDGLHQKAGSQKVLDMHGNFLSSHCLRCRKAYDYHELKAMVLQHVIPHCTCRGIIKPDIVFFGEDVKYYHKALELAQSADLFFVIGTSCVVYPAASLPQFVPGKIVIVNNSKIDLKMYNIALEIEGDIDVFFNDLMKALKGKLSI